MQKINKELKNLNELIDYLIELRDKEGLGEARVKREVVMQDENNEWLTRYEPLCTDYIKVTKWNNEIDLPDENGNYLKEPSDLIEIHFLSECDWIDDYYELSDDYPEDEDEDNGESEYW